MYKTYKNPRNNGENSIKKCNNENDNCDIDPAS